MSTASPPRSGRSPSELIDHALADRADNADWALAAERLRPGRPVLAGRLRDRFAPWIAQDQISELGLLAANVLATGALGRDAPERELGIASDQGVYRALIVFHGPDRQRRSLLVLDPSLPKGAEPRVVDSRTLQTLIERGLALSVDWVERQTGDPDLAVEALWAARPRVIVAPKPKMVRTWSPRPPVSAEHPNGPSTVGVCARDVRGRTGVTVCFHGAGPVGTTVLIEGIERQVVLASETLDTCFVEIPETELPSPGGAQGRAGPLTSRAPGQLEQHEFWGIRTKAQTVRISSVDPSVPTPRRGRQLCVQTEPVTKRGDSGSALVNRYDEVVGFAFQRTAVDDPLQFADWIWAHSAFHELGLAPI